MENKTAHYFKYAIGEIILVVVGILIALQINNWNTNHNNNLLEQEYLNRLQEEAKWNIEQLEYNSLQYIDRAKKLNKTIEFLESQNQNMSVENFSRPNYIHAWITKNTTYNELISNGDLKIIKDLRLRDLLNQAISFNEFANKQLEQWRNLAVAHEILFIPYKKSIAIYKADSLYYTDGLNYNKMKKDSTAIELLKYWSHANMVFYEGTVGLKKNYEKIFDRIECLKQNKKCPTESNTIIKN